MKWQLKNFTPKNIYYTIQGHYRAFIIRQYGKLTGIKWVHLSNKIIECSACLGNHPICGCPWAELLLSDKPCDCEQYSK